MLFGLFWGVHLHTTVVLPVTHNSYALLLCVPVWKKTQLNFLNSPDYSKENVFGYIFGYKYLDSAVPSTPNLHFFLLFFFFFSLVEKQNIESMEFKRKTGGLAQRKTRTKMKKFFLLMKIKVCLLAKLNHSFCE